MNDKPGLSPAVLRTTTIALGCGLILQRVIADWHDWTLHGLAGFGVAVFSGFMVGLPVLSKMYGHVDIEELPQLLKEAYDARGMGFPDTSPPATVDKSADQDTTPTMPT